MKVYEQLSTEQLEKHREVLLAMLAALEAELVKRAGRIGLGEMVAGENLEDHQLDFLE